MLENKSGNISETRKHRGKATIDGLYRNSPTLFRTVPSTTPYGLPFLEIGVCNLATPLISGTGKATDFKFEGHIYIAIPNKSPLKISEKMERGRIQGLSKFFGYPYYLGNG